MNRRDPKFSKTLEARLSHLKSLMEIYHWQSEQVRCFLREDPHHSWSQSTKALRTLESVSGDRVCDCSPVKQTSTSWDCARFKDDNFVYEMLARRDLAMCRQEQAQWGKTHVYVLVHSDSTSGMGNLL